MSLKEDIQAEAFRLGFWLVGAALPTAPPHYPAYQRWLEHGLHAGMAYLSSENAFLRRADPGSALPGCRTILSLAFPYASPLSQPAPAFGRGRVAAYAWGTDYHSIIPPRLDQLAEQVRKITRRPVQFKSYTDTGPILERDLASQAGLGWIGKNTCLIAPRKGSFFFLSELLLDIELDPDVAFQADRCGTCQRCVHACPTGCIRLDRTVDSNRCISYLTIENKGTIPLDLRSSLKNWVFGCDICQLVCPWNRKTSSQTGNSVLAAANTNPHPQLVETIRLSPLTFNQKYRLSPIQRARRRGLLRNAAVAVGNLRDQDTIPTLRQVMETEPEPLVRAHTAWALGQLNTAAAHRTLEKAQRTDPDPDVQVEIASALLRG